MPNSTASFFALFAICLSHGYAIDKEMLPQIVRAASDQFDDFSCEFEGAFSYPMQSGVEKEGVGERFDGFFMFRKDGACLCDVYHHDENSGRIRRETIATLRGKTELYGRSDDARNGRGTTRVATAVDFYKKGSFGRIYSRDFFLGIVTHPTAVVTDVGTELVGGEEVSRFDVVSKSSKTGKIGDSVISFWMNLEHGFPMRIEQKDHLKLHSRLEIKEVRPFNVGANRVWLPVHGVHEAFGTFDEKKSYVATDYPTNRETVTMLWKTLKFNTHPNDKMFSPSYRDGDVITDHLKKIKYEFDHQKVDKPLLGAAPTREQVENQLKAAVEAAEAQGDELKASSLERSGRWGLATIFPWIVAIVSSVTLVIVLLRRRG